MKRICKKDLQFMKLCLSGANIFSTCGKKQYAALLVNKKNHIIGFGYNGGPSGFTHCVEGGCERLKEKSRSGSVYDNCIAIHAEANAFLHSNYVPDDLKLYVNGPPCFSCAKLIANSTVTAVYYINDPEYSNWNQIKDFLNKANVQTIEVDINASF